MSSNSGPSRENFGLIRGNDSEPRAPHSSRDSRAKVATAIRGRVDVDATLCGDRHTDGAAPPPAVSAGQRWRNSPETPPSPLLQPPEAPSPGSCSRRRAVTRCERSGPRSGGQRRNVGATASGGPGHGHRGRSLHAFVARRVVPPAIWRPLSFAHTPRRWRVSRRSISESGTCGQSPRLWSDAFPLNGYPFGLG